MLKLTPAYDICSQPRTGGEATQAMLIQGETRMSRLIECINAAPQFLLSKAGAIQITEEIANSIISNWEDVCEESEVSQVGRKLFSNHQFFNRFAFENLDDDSKNIEKLASRFRRRS